ncbi:hypothetical protein ACP4OV_010353 [Aristida adscensionis]
MFIPGSSQAGSHSAQDNCHNGNPNPNENVHRDENGCSDHDSDANELSDFDADHNCTDLVGDHGGSEAMIDD